ncbi:NAD-dependent epimerase/dehydratase family protein, partial [Streptococcus suis]
QAPDRGPVVVTGATGGVGSLAVDMLAGHGYEVVAVSGKTSAEAYLKSLGARTILPRQQIDFGSRPLEAARFAGAVDNVGGEMLTWLTRTVNF